MLLNCQYSPYIFHFIYFLKLTYSESLATVFCGYSDFESSKLYYKNVFKIMIDTIPFYLVDNNNNYQV